MLWNWSRLGKSKFNFNHIEIYCESKVTKTTEVALQMTGFASPVISRSTREDYSRSSFARTVVASVAPGYFAN